jgi:DNA repair exonuclease SbcCD ATPase subunit
MKLKKIEWRNIGPFGNKLQTLELPDEGGLWMVVGKNGNGKSFFVNLPKILYYGKLDRFKKDEIANRLNKHGWIKGLDEISPDTFATIERNFSPSNLTVWKHGYDEEVTEENNIGKAGITDYQAYIDTEVTGLPYHIFSNIISLSINDFKSFISMTPNDKRIIIDKLFAMDIINKMNQLVKSDLRDMKFNMDAFDRDIITIKNNIDVAVKELQKLQVKLNEDNSSKILELAAKLEEYKPKLQEGYDKKKEWESKKADILKSQTVFVRQKAKVSQELQHLRNQINLYNQDKCPTCATPFDDARFDLIKEQLQENIKTEEKEIELIKENEQKYNMALENVNQGLVKIDNFIIQIQTSYKLVEAELTKLKLNKSAEFESIQNIISENKESLIKKSDDKLKYDEEYKYLTVLEQLYSDAGVKKKILESYLPTLNKEIEYTLNELHFPYRLIFDSDFEPNMSHLGVDISVDTLSTGEKKRVDLAVLISIIRMLKHKYPGLNIFMLDEVLSSIDGDGIYDIIGLLQKLSREMAMNIFVINFSPLPIEQFDYKIEIHKNAGFSDLTIEKLNEGD